MTSCLPLCRGATFCGSNKTDKLFYLELVWKQTFCNIRFVIETA